MQRVRNQSCEKALLSIGKRNWNQLTHEHGTIDFVNISSTDGLLASECISSIAHWMQNR
jgi:hypothetical protein